MDVLHFLKSNHDLVRAGLARVDNADGVKARRVSLDELSRDLQVHLALEKDYLYPEIQALFPEAETLVTTGLANAGTIGRRLKTLLKLAAKPVAEQEGYSKRLAELKESVIKHLDLEEQHLMPKIRSSIRTEEREDLGQVFMDVKAEVLQSLDRPVVVAPVANGRRRA